MAGRLLGDGKRSMMGTRIAIRAAPSGAGLSLWGGVAIDMALLTELFPSPSLPFQRASSGLCLSIKDSRMRPVIGARTFLSAYGGALAVGSGQACPMPLGFQPMPFGYSLRGHCHTERRKDRWFGNPEGIVSSSPGWPSPRGYPGLTPVRFSTPPGLCPRSAIAPQPR